ncbi:MAG TPA: DNA mismatch repair protein MutS [Verrucomicrobiales bacterium]|nr:DNA mismatch repair protein MutS [Verrucomicrobiales bacterium]
MMAQYRSIKNELPKGALLFFRLGDFYELFFDDAKEGASILNVALTKRGNMPMCGIPYHAANNYISRILKAGRQVAICDQVEEAKPGKLVRRQVTQIISPGTHFDERILKADENNFIATVCSTGKTIGLAYVDLTTGVFKATEFNNKEDLHCELERLHPSELIYASEDHEVESWINGRCKVIHGYDGWVFDLETSLYTVREHFSVASLDGFGLRNHDAAVGAAGAILHYLKENLRRDVSHLTSVSYYQSSDFMALDVTSLTHLEILEPLHRDAPKPACLYDAVNKTVTPMGARRLRDWLSRPLSSVKCIRERQEAVGLWMQVPQSLIQIRGNLKEVRDLERTITRLSVGSGNARDLLNLKTALEQVPEIRKILDDLPTEPFSADCLPSLALEESETTTDETVELSLMQSLALQMNPLPELTDKIGEAVAEEPPVTLKEGGIITDGFDASLDELRQAMREGKQWIAELQKSESEKNRIPSLKIRFNSVFGYFLEVTRANLDKVPEHYIRKQTMANGERYITPELKEMESKILGAEERAAKLEYELFLRLRETVISHLTVIQQIADTAARLDVLASFAETARQHNYCRPQILEEGILQIEEGRHPVLEQGLSDERFVPNDVNLDCETSQVALITGPNMAGKSTYIRQTALLTLLAHTGSFIPASKARIDLVDRIFTRIGASDDLSRGQSTFMVEMSETANILNNASSHSLIILDEIGRGTSTFDGLSLAWSIVEYLHHHLGSKTLFATHYHELTELAGRLPRVSNFNVVVKEWNDKIVFIRKIVPGGTDKSYGIQVARLAGIPKEVIERSKEVLRNLEESDLNPDGTSKRARRNKSQRKRLQELPESPQLDLFS